jgi:hypothetical protein
VPHRATESRHDRVVIDSHAYRKHCIGLEAAPVAGTQAFYGCQDAGYIQVDWIE